MSLPSYFPPIMPTMLTAQPPSTSPHQAAVSATGDRTHITNRNNVRVVGTGSLTLLFCNGFGCNQHIWRHLSTPLLTRYRVVLFDHVGSGDSDLSAYTLPKYDQLAAYAQDVVEICQALDLQDVVLVGHSVGAMIAMLAAIQAPAHFAKCIMLAPSPCYLNKPGYYGGLAEEDLNQLLTVLDADQNSWANLFAGLLVGTGNPASLGEELAGYFCNMDSTIARHFARVAFQSDNRADLVKLHLPTLVIQCQDDNVVSEEAIAFTMTQLPDARLVRLKASGHCPHLSAPLETMMVMEAFIAE